VDMLVFGRSHIDHTSLARKANGACSYRLSDVYKAVLNKELEHAHGAVYDSQAVIDLLSVTAIGTKLHTLLVTDCQTDTCITNLMKLIQIIKIRTRTPKRKQTTDIRQFFKKQRTV